MENDFLALETAEDGVTVVELRGPGKVTTLNEGMIDALEELVETLEGSESTRAVVFVGSKPSGFMAGADLKELTRAWEDMDPDQIRSHGEALVGRLQVVFNRIEKLPVPTVAAIHGAALGGGYELALACSARIAAESSSTKVGLPEVNLGLIPAAGGTQRMTRLVGMANAMDLILAGKRLDAKRAMKKGLVDRLCPPDALRTQAVRFARGLADTREKLRRKKRQGFAVRVMEAVGFGRDAIESRALKSVQKKTKGNYPAPVHAARLISFAADGGALDEGLRREREAFGELIDGPVARNLIQVFFMMEGGKTRPPPGDAEPREVRRIGVVGAGFMGSGVAQLAAFNGYRIYLKDRDDEALARGMKSVAKLFKGLDQRGKLRPGGMRAAMGMVQPCLEYPELRRSDLVVEAVFEDRDLKRKVLADVEAVVDEETVIATNTSGIPLSELTSALERPKNLVGMHFFSPVHKMPLLEVIRGEESTEEAVATVVKVGQRMGKSVVVVADGPGFFTTRVLGIFLCEVFKALMEGSEVGALDRAFEEFGWPVGPFKLMDEVGIDVGAKVSRNLHEAFPDRVPSADPIVALLDRGRTGKKGGKGFYRYEKGKSTGEVDESVYQDLSGRRPESSRRPREVVRRVMDVLVNECTRCLEEGVISSPTDGDTAMVLGLGFPPFRGGVFRWADDEGAAAFAERLRERAGEEGDAYAPCDLLASKAEASEKFHGKGGAQ